MRWMGESLTMVRRALLSRMLIFLSYSAVVVWGVELLANDLQTVEICLGSDHSVLECSADTVILVEQSRYGRMKYGGACVGRQENIGCSANVKPQVERRCSGRQSCTLIIDASIKNSSHRCDADLQAYLEVTYRCLPIYNTDLPCSPSEPLKITEDFGYISSLVTLQTQRGSTLCPWQITAQPGRTISLSLLDFGFYSISATSNQQRPPTPHPLGSCLIYGHFKEGGVGHPGRILGSCAGEERGLGVGVGLGEEVGKVVYSSLSNAVNLSLVPVKDVHFIIKFQAVGCSDYSGSPDARVRRTGDKMLVKCGGVGERGEGEGEEWEAVCVNNTWIPDRTCPLGVATGQISSATTGAPSIQVVYIILVVVVAVIISVAIIIVGILYLRCKSRELHLANGGAQFDGTSMMQYSMTPFYDGGCKDQMCARSADRMAAERDYATTLQMRFNAAAAYHSCGNGGVEVWTCPVHGPVLTPTAYDHRVLGQCNGRPRMEHIYEIPNLGGDGGPESPELGNRSPFYHELDPGASLALQMSGGAGVNSRGLNVPLIGGGGTTSVAGVVPMCNNNNNNNNNNK